MAAVRRPSLTPVASYASGSEPPPAVSGLADAVLEAFKTHRLVGLGEIHGLQNHGDALTLLLSDPRLPDVVDDIVVEFGNALYQHTIDRFIAGQPVNDADLRRVWRNSVFSPLATGDEPMYEQAYRTIRAANWAQPPNKRMRVLLGDVPIDWSKITNSCEWMRFTQTRDRDHYFASVVKKHVLAKGRRALLLKGLDAFVRPNAIEQVTGERVYAIVDLAFAASDPGGVGRKLAGYPHYTVIPAAGTWLGSADAGLLFGDVGTPGPGLKLVPRRRCRNGKPYGKPVKPRGGNTNGATNQNCGKTVQSLVDAGLYLGPPAELTASWPNPAIYLDPTYWKELQRRNTIGISVDLNWYRQEHPQANVNWWRPLKCGRHARARHWPAGCRSGTDQRCRHRPDARASPTRSGSCSTSEAVATSRRLSCAWAAAT